MKPKKIAVKKSGAKAASMAGKWMSHVEVDRKWTIAHAVHMAALGNRKRLTDLVNMIDTLAASVLSQKELQRDKEGK